MVVLDLSSCDGSSVLFFSFSPSARSNPHAMAAPFFGTRCMQEQNARAGGEESNRVTAGSVSSQIEF
jgi:hypothetical protein